jgi:hypothetical protein
MLRQLRLALSGTGLALVVLVSCETAPLTAPDGSTIFLQANPTFVISNGGASVVTAVVNEPAGTFVPDGTELFFFTNLGRIDPVGKTVRGVARVNFVSDSRSGKATITAISGQAPGGTNPSVEISIGNALPSLVLVTADPQRITTPRNSRITATVFDANGNPVQNVPVAFSFQIQDPLVVPLVEETLDSGGALLYTNANGQVTDTLRTQAPFGLGQKTVAVTAVTPVAAATGFVTVFVD